RLWIRRRMVEMKTIGSGLDHGIPAAGDVIEGEPEKKNTSHQEQHTLYGIRPHHGVEPAEQCIAPCSQHDTSHHIVLVPTGQFTDRDTASIKDRREKNKYIADDHHH